MSFRQLLDDAAAEHDGIDTAANANGDTTWSRAGSPFATLRADGKAAEFALDPAVAAAAIRTSDVAPSGRGPGWVAFEPTALDDHAADRATAWFRSAYRRLATR